MLAGRRPAAAVLAAGLIAAGAGTAGLLLTRHPTVIQAAAARAFPAPTGPIAASRSGGRPRSPRRSRWKSRPSGCAPRSFGSA